MALLSLSIDSSNLLLKKIVEDPIKWNQHLSTVQYVMNNTFHSALKTSLSKLLFGYDQRGHSDNALVQYLTDLAANHLNVNDERLKDCRIAVDTTEKLRNYNKIYYDKRHKQPSLYKEGDYVFIRDTIVKQDENKKLKSNYKGPYVIAKILNKNRYVVQDIPGFNICQKSYNSILSPDRLKPWIKPVTDSEQL